MKKFKLKNPRPLTEDQVNNQSYSLVLENLERLSKENEEMEKIRKK